MTAKLYWPSAFPCAAALLNQFRAFEKSFGTPSPDKYIMAKTFWLAGSPPSAFSINAGRSGLVTERALAASCATPGKDHKRNKNGNSDAKRRRAGEIAHFM
jgi:hypothetical protein